MKVIVVGKGGREHAIVTALVESDSASEVFCYPGSDAILEMAKSLSGEINDVESLVKSMVDEGIDLCVGGEESWLAMGLADKATDMGTRSVFISTGSEQGVCKRVYGET